MYHIPFYVCIRFWAKFVRIFLYLAYMQLTESLTEQMCFLTDHERFAYQDCLTNEGIHFR